MMAGRDGRLKLRRLLLGAAALGLGACSHAGNVSAMATDYNRAIANARSEQVLLNVLRASGREPLQFTAVGEITATVNRTIGIDTVAANLLAGGRNAISASLSSAAGPRRSCGSRRCRARISPPASCARSRPKCSTCSSARAGMGSSCCRWWSAATPATAGAW
jgi:hypothetical protein